MLAVLWGCAIFLSANAAGIGDFVMLNFCYRFRHHLFGYPMLAQFVGDSQTAKPGFSGMHDLLGIALFR